MVETEGFRFGPYVLDVAGGRLMREGVPVALAPKVFDLLRLLVERPGRLLTKRELIARLWPDTFVEEANLTQHVFTLRKILGEQPDGTPYIDTVSRRGYRFAGDVERVGATPRAALASYPADRVSGVATSEETHAGTALAILPFRALTGGAGDEDLAVGMADAVITRLACVKGLAVRATSSVLRFAGSTDPSAAGGALGADAVLDGRFQLVEDRIRVTAQLIDVRSGGSLWAGTFDESFHGVFAVQDAISRRVAEALVSNLTAQERDRIGGRRTSAPSAYRSYLRGRYCWERRTPETLRTSLEEFRRAIELDPGYALAYAGLADSYNILGNFGVLPPADAYAQAKAAAGRALAIDPSIAEAEVAQAFAAYLYDRDWTAAEKQFERALVNAPGYGPGHQWYAVCLVSRGRFDEALAQIQQAVEADPASVIINAVAAWIEYLVRDYTGALARLAKTAEMDPSFVTLHSYRGLIYAAQRRHPEAVTELRAAVEARDALPKDLGALGHELAIQGDSQGVREVEEALDSARHDDAGHVYAQALIDLGRRDDAALIRLARAADARYPWAIHYNIDPMLDSIRNRPAFKALLGRIGLPQVRLPPQH